MTWHVDLHPADATIRSLLLTDRWWTAYALGDLYPPLRERTTFYHAQAGDQWAIVLIYRTASFTALQPFGPPEGIEALLKYIPDLPEACIISNCTDEQQFVITRAYDLLDYRPMYRMGLTAATFRRIPGDSEALSVHDMTEMAMFYKFAEAEVRTFSPDQVEHGLYRGVRRYGMLVAVGGTHFILPQEQIAALGNIYADPVVRGQGYARIITSTIVAMLFARGCSDIVLNVSRTNYHSLYVVEQVGFVQHAPFWEASARLKGS